MRASLWTFTRKAILGSALALAGTAVLSAAELPASAVAPNMQATAQAGYFKTKLGALTIVALSDGGLSFDTAQGLIEDRPGAVKALLDKAHLPQTIAMPINAFLVDTGNKRILVDAGTGTFFGPDAGKLPASLRAAGYSPENIDDILITHPHPDHVGGIILDGKLVYPHATIHVNQVDLAFWLDKKDNASKVDPDPRLQQAFDNAATALKPYIAAHRVKSFRAGQTVIPEIKAVAVDISGHTPGQTAYVIESEGHKLVFVGDLVHVVAAQLPDPRIAIHFDASPSKAVQTRERVLLEAAKEGYWVAGPHIPFPGIGHVRRQGDGYTWDSVKPGQSLD